MNRRQFVVRSLAASTFVLDCSIPNILAEELPYRRAKLKPTEEDGVRGIAYSPDGKKIAVVVGCERSGGSGILVSSIESPNKFGFVGQANGAIGGIRFLKDSTKLVSAGEHGECRLWDSVMKRRVGEFKGHSDDILCMTINYDSSLLVTGCVGGRIRIWNLANQKEVAIINMQATAFRDVACHPAKNVVAIATTSKLLKFWDFEKKEKLFDLEHREALLAARFISKGNSIVTLESDGVLRVQEIHWDTKTSKETLRRSIGKCRNAVLDISADEMQVAIGADADLIIMSLSPVAVIKQITMGSHNYPVTSLAFGQNDSLCTSSFMEPYVWMWSKWPR